MAVCHVNHIFGNTQISQVEKMTYEKAVKEVEESCNLTKSGPSRSFRWEWKNRIL